MFANAEIDLEVSSFYHWSYTAIGVKLGNLLYCTFREKIIHFLFYGLNSCWILGLLWDGKIDVDGL